MKVTTMHYDDHEHQHRVLITFQDDRGTSTLAMFLDTWKLLEHALINDPAHSFQVVDES